MTVAVKRTIALISSGALLAAVATMPAELWAAAPLVPTFWPWAITGLVVSALSVSSLVDQSDRWWRIVTWLAAASTIVSLVQMLIFASAGVNNVLTRDIVAIVLMAALLPMVGGSTARVIRRSIGVSWIAAWCCAVVSAVMIAIAPGIWLLTHCSSGDCL